jgi:hypothetical protein|tara:strand:+ start:205 stop:960 length:756 start_codon:yes stop_codon:yes gene_type:complete
MFIPFILFGQNIDMYLSLLDDGQAFGVKEKIPELVSKYPNEPGVMYLQALLTIDGAKALETYSKIIEKFPQSKYSVESSVKIGEYFYARGLYSQASRQLCLIPRQYPRYPGISRVISLMAGSFQAIGAQDSLKYYMGIYQSMFPNMDFGDQTSKVKPIVNTDLKETSLKPKSKPYIIQIGAFGNIQNAKRLKLQVNQIGYNVEIKVIETNGRTLNAVRIVSYKSKSEAERVGKVVKNRLGLDYRVLYRPKK